MGLFNSNLSEIKYLLDAVYKLTERIDVLESNARYIADQPAYQLFSLSQFKSNWNEVPINKVVKAIVKHLDMEIENVSEKTIQTPQEVKVVPKSVTGVAMMGPTGVVVMPDGKGIPMPNPKRKYTKRKTNGQKAKTKKSN